MYLYGGQDTFSGRINLLRIWTTNSNPTLLAGFTWIIYIKVKVSMSLQIQTLIGCLHTGCCFLMIFSNKIIQNFIESIRYATTTSMHNKGCEGMSGEQLANI